MVQVASQIIMQEATHKLASSSHVVQDLCQACFFLPGHVIPFMACLTCRYTPKAPLSTRIQIAIFIVLCLLST